MSRGALTAIIAVLIIAAAAIGIAANREDNKTSNTPNTNNNQNSNNDQTQPAGQNNSGSNNAVSTSSVSIANMAFSPADITIKKGTTVTWTNNDNTVHNVKETDGKTGPDSEDLNPGDKYTFTFDEVGTFSYNCTIHPTMTGTVTVTE